MLQRCTRSDSQDLVINSGIATDQQIRHHLIPYASLFPHVLSANGIDSSQNFNLLHYTAICLPTFISRNRCKDLTSRLGLLFWCKAKLAFAKLESQHCCSKRDLNVQYKSPILPKFWANYCSDSNELFLEKLNLENNIFWAVSDENLTSCKYLILLYHI